MKPGNVALLCGVTYVAFRVMLYMANLQHQVKLMVQAPFIPLYGIVCLAIIYVIFQYKKNTTGYNWLDAFKTGGKVALLSGLIASMGVFIYYRFIDTDYLSIVSIEFYNLRKSEGLSEDQLKNVLEFTKTVNTPFMRSTLLLSVTTTLGLVTSLIISWLVRMMLVSKS